MQNDERINIDIFKVVTRAIAKSCNLEIMAKHLTQLLVGAMEIKGATIFASNIETKELEPGHRSPAWPRFPPRLPCRKKQTADRL